MCQSVCIVCVKCHIHIYIYIYIYTYIHTHTHVYVQGGVEVDVGYVAVPIQRVSRAGKEDGWYELRTIDDEVRVCVCTRVHVCVCVCVCARA
jgi:hypothetical protein